MKIRNKGKEILCSGCGGAFDDTLPKCPYCGILNYKGAEAEYLSKLEAVNDHMEELGDVPAIETGKAIRRRSRSVLKLLVILAACMGALFLLFLLLNREEKRDNQADFLWKRENYPKLDALYEQEQYEELMNVIEQAVDEEKPVYGWEHMSFYDEWDRCRSVLAYLAGVEQSGEKVSVDLEEWLLRSYWRLKCLPDLEVLTDEELARLDPYRTEVLEKLEKQFAFTQQERESFEKELRSNYGYLPEEACKAYFKNSRKGK